MEVRIARLAPSTNTEARGGNHELLERIITMLTQPVYQNKKDSVSAPPSPQAKTLRGIHHPAFTRLTDTSAISGKAVIVESRGRGFGDAVMCPHCNKVAFMPVNDPIGTFLVELNKELWFRLRQVGVTRLALYCDCHEWSWVNDPEVG